MQKKMSSKNFWVSGKKYLEGRQNLRSAPGGRHPSYATGVAAHPRRVWLLGHCSGESYPECVPTKVEKMRAKLANLNPCAVSFLSRAAVNVSWYDSIMYTV